jgi:hypothetical protein
MGQFVKFYLSDFKAGKIGLEAEKHRNSFAPMGAAKPGWFEFLNSLYRIFKYCQEIV